MAKIVKNKKVNEQEVQKVQEIMNGFIPELDQEKESIESKSLEDLENFKKDEEKEEKDIPLESGFDNTIKALFPEPIYIPAVKDLSDDMKTKESASFGKLLNILLDVIEEDLTDAKEVFENLRKKLNKTFDDNGNVILDERIEKVKEIEATIQKNLNETFKNVSIELEVPPPEIRTILSSATIIANDGVRGPIENKGDGFKRAITFSILRSYVELSHSKDWQKEEQKNKQKDKFLFLFEEPELYLHPNAQNILFEALALISKKHQIVVTTHSPLFFAPNDTKTFIKIKKNSESQKPYSDAKCIDLSDISLKDKFQIISFETSNHAFFANKIVLVEGDSELIVLPHIAKLINPEYDFKNKSISLVKTGGKGSFKRYKEFFKNFDIEIYLIADLDILIDGFDKLDTNDTSKELHSKLMDKISNQAKTGELPKTKKYKNELSKEKSKSLYEELKEARQNGLDKIFSFEQNNTKLELLKNDKELKIELLKQLWDENIFILSRGDIESYYPEDLTNSDKPSMAQEFCQKIMNNEELFNLYDKIIDEKIEFEIIFDKIFEG